MQVDFFVSTLFSNGEKFYFFIWNDIIKTALIDCYCKLMKIISKIRCEINT